MTKQANGRDEILARAVLAEEIEMQPNGWGLNKTVGNQGEWISHLIIDEWVHKGLIEIKGSIGRIKPSAAS